MMPREISRATRWIIRGAGLAAALVTRELRRLRCSHQISTPVWSTLTAATTSAFHIFARSSGGCQPAMVRTHSRAHAMLSTPGNSRRNSTTADSAVVARMWLSGSPQEHATSWPRLAVVSECTPTGNLFVRKRRRGNRLRQVAFHSALISGLSIGVTR